ncbi:hypothetical protein ACHAWF_002541 [Thalassiosira exigua]
MDNTIGHSSNARSGSEIETSAKREEPAVGQVRLRSGETKPLYDGASLAPDLGALEGEDRPIWVRANSVFVRGNHVVRQTRLHELFAMWDYKGKVGLRDLQLKDRWKVLELRLGSPPAKICENLALQVMRYATNWSGDDVGRTIDVPFSPLEESAQGRVKAAQPDDAEVDLSAWALPGETPKMVKARQVLRRLALRWWKHYQEKHAREWLKSYTDELTPEDYAGVEDCLRRVRATTYFSWPRGSRHHFWKVKDPDWRRDF